MRILQGYQVPGLSHLSTSLCYPEHRTSSQDARWHRGSHTQLQGGLEHIIFQLGILLLLKKYGRRKE